MLDEPTVRPAMAEPCAIAAIDRAFGSVPKPVHFTNFSHCEECAEHDELLRGRDRETLSIHDIDNPGWDPFCFSSPEGMAFYMPALARFALAKPSTDYAWYGDQLLFHLYAGAADNPFYIYCSDEQKAAVAAFLHEMITTRADLIEAHRSSDEFLRAYGIWSGGAANA